MIKRFTLFAILFAPLCASAQLPWEMLKNPEFRAAYHDALGAKKTEKWLMSLDGPSVPSTTEVIKGAEYVLSDSCKPHWCNILNIVFAYAPASKKVFGKLVEAGAVSWLGNPPSDVQAMLEVKYAKRFSRK